MSLKSLEDVKRIFDYTDIGSSEGGRYIGDSYNTSVLQEIENLGVKDVSAENIKNAFEKVAKDKHNKDIRQLLDLLESIAEIEHLYGVSFQQEYVLYENILKTAEDDKIISLKTRDDAQRQQDEVLSFIHLRGPKLKDAAARFLEKLKKIVGISKIAVKRCFDIGYYSEDVKAFINTGIDELPHKFVTFDEIDDVLNKVMTQLTHLKASFLDWTCFVISISGLGDLYDEDIHFKAFYHEAHSRQNGAVVDVIRTTNTSGLEALLVDMRRYAKNLQTDEMSKVIAMVEGEIEVRKSPSSGVPSPQELAESSSMRDGTISSQPSAAISPTSRRDSVSTHIPDTEQGSKTPKVFNFDTTVSQPSSIVPPVGVPPSVVPTYPAIPSPNSTIHNCDDSLIYILDRNIKSYCGSLRPFLESAIVSYENNWSSRVCDSSFAQYLCYGNDVICQISRDIAKLVS